MSGIIHFTSGKELEITEREFQNIAPKLSGKGIKVHKTAGGHMLPLNSSTMEYIEHIPEWKEVPVDIPPAKESTTVGIVIEELKEDIPKMDKQEDPKKKTQDELLQDIMAKSDCKHEPEKLRLYVQRTAKGIRYFPVCSFCGKRERYISESKVMKNEYVGTVNEKWNENDIANALPWIEK